jgi:adenosylcobyric acid synthase
LVTQFALHKKVQHTQAQFNQLKGPWSALSGVQVSGYEIHHGKTQAHTDMQAQGVDATEVMPGLAWQNPTGNVLGCYVHGLFEDPRVVQALFGHQAPTLDAVMDGLADFLEQHIPPEALRALIAD